MEVDHLSRALYQIRHAQLKVMVEREPIILVAVDQFGVVVHCEGLGLIAFGRRAEEIAGHSIWEASRSIPELPEYFSRAIAGDAVDARICVHSTILKVHLAQWKQQAQIAGVIGVATDITEQVRAEAVMHCVEFGLTPHERRVLPFLANPELSYNDVGKRLHLEPESVRSYAKSVADKLGVSARRAILAGAIRQHQLLPPS